MIVLKGLLLPLLRSSSIGLFVPTKIGIADFPQIELTSAGEKRQKIPSVTPVRKSALAICPTTVPRIPATNLNTLGADINPGNIIEAGSQSNSSVVQSRKLVECYSEAECYDHDQVVSSDMRDRDVREPRVHTFDQRNGVSSSFHYVSTHIKVKPTVWESLPVYAIKGSLKRCLNFWQSFTNDHWVLSVVRDGWEIPFERQPPGFCLKNNLSARKEKDFVELSILEFLKNDIIMILNEKPKYVNPLSVAIQSNGKKRFILDASFLNLFIPRQHFKLEDWSTAIEYAERDGYAWTFDLKKGYFHVDLHPNSYQYTCFAWNFQGVELYFCFKVMCFGI